MVYSSPVIIGTCFCVTRDRTVKAGPQNFMPSAIGLIERSTLPLFGNADPVQPVPDIRHAQSFEQLHDFLTHSVLPLCRFVVVFCAAPEGLAHSGELALVTS